MTDKDFYTTTIITTPFPTSVANLSALRTYYKPQGCEQVVKVVRFVSDTIYHQQNQAAVFLRSLTPVHSPIGFANAACDN